MAIEIDTDSYVTIAEADAYINNHYISSDDKRVAWEALEDEDKEISLRNATDAMEGIRYIGTKKDDGQVLAFPRCYKNAHHLPTIWYDTRSKKGGHWYCEVQVSDTVKEAQVEEALEMASPSIGSNDYANINGSISSYSMTGLSETYKNMPSGVMGTVYTELRSKKAQKLLSAYVGGGYCVN